MDKPELSLPGLENLLRNYYHQCEWLDASGNEALWKVYFRNEACDAGQLLYELETLLIQRPEAIASFIRVHASAASYSLSACDALKWSQDFKSWCAATVAQQCIPADTFGAAEF